MLARHRVNHAEPTPSHGPTARKPSAPVAHAPEAPVPVPEETDMLTGTLVQMGLSIHEAQMYRSLLEGGPSTARAAIEHSHLDRATGYRILSRRRARGLVSASGYRPQRFVALDATKLLDRITSFWRDEIDLHRIVRDLYQAGLPSTPAPSPGAPSPIAPAALSSPPTLARAPGRFKIVPGLERVGRQLVESIEGAREEVGALLRPHLIPEPYRGRVRGALAQALRRSIRVRLVVDYHPPELDFLSELLHDFPEAGPGLEIRFYAPQLARLVVVDRRAAFRCIHSAQTQVAGPDLGILSEEFEYVRTQTGRFQSTWREAVPLEAALRSPMGSVLAPPSSSKELRSWVERASRSELKGPVAESFGMSFPPRWMR
jgi:sugar-specific transcriptional regulator TrmB